MKAYLTGLTIGALLLFAPVNYAWNDTGHILISTEAFELLSPALRKKYVNILKQHPRFQEDFVTLGKATFNDQNRGKDDAWIFAFASIWPDLSRHFGHVKSAKERDKLVEKYNRGPWHYVNHPLYLAAKDRAALAIAEPTLGIKPAPVLRAMNIVQALAFTEVKIRNRHLTVANRAVYLGWWLHLMGDLHQPLHNVALFAKRRFAKGDRGGNSVRVGKKRNLHSVWDGSLSLDIAARKADDSRIKLHTSDGRSNYVGWSHESAELANKEIYTGEVRKVISRKGRLPHPGEQQNKKRVAIAQAQAALASQRISQLLGEF